MTNHEIWKLIKLYITGSIQPHERMMLERWMEQHPDNRKLVSDITRMWVSTQDNSFNVDVEQAWQTFLRNRKKRTIARDSKPKLRNDAKPYLYPVIRKIYRKSFDSSWYMLRLAAILLVAVLTGVMVYHYTAGIIAEDGNTQLVMEELVTGNGEKARVTFSDGTQVTLNAASSLNFPREFRDSRRVVYLEGEAYFKVAPNSEFPFVVHAQDVDIKVLGTEFNVRSRVQDPGVEVIVRQGKVSVETPGSVLEGDRSVILTAGLQTSVKWGQTPMAPWEVDVKNKLVWLNGGLHFENTPFESVIRDLERRFNVQIRVQDEELLDLLFTSTFQYAKLDEILSVIAGAMEIEYRQEGSEIIFS